MTSMFEGNVTLSQSSPHLLHKDGKPYNFAMDVGEGWEDLCSRTFGKIAEVYVKNGMDLSSIFLHQIKEKFGGLRIYLSGAGEEVDDIIEAAEKESYTICEVCGEKGQPRQGGWIKTLCDNHAQ